MAMSTEIFGSATTRARQAIARRFYVVAVMSLATLGLSGCWFKKKQPNVPPQATAPTVQVTPPPPPAQQNPAPAVITGGTTPSQTQEQQERQQKPQPAPATTHRVRPRTRPPQKITDMPKPAPGASSANSASNAGGAPHISSSPEPAITISGGDDPHDKQTTQQLLDSTDLNLLQITRQLSQDEVNIVQQIRAYEKDAREAIRQEDYTKAHTLALKAHLLSDTLVKR